MQLWKRYSELTVTQKLRFGPNARMVVDPAAKVYGGFGGGLPMYGQAAPTAKTVSATLTAAEILTGLITVNQGAGAASALQLPTAAALDTALPNSVPDDAFNITLINISTVAAEDASITTNTGWTLVGNMDVASNDAATSKSVGTFRARKTAAGAWTLYRIS